MPKTKPSVVTKVNSFEKERTYRMITVVGYIDDVPMRPIVPLSNIPKSKAIEFCETVERIYPHLKTKMFVDHTSRETCEITQVELKR
jgi:hypothetical protein